MDIHNTDSSVVYLSKGKTGTTSLENYFGKKGWDISADKYTFFEYATLPEFEDTTFNIVIRDPKHRYKSGIRELLWGPHIFDAQPLTDTEYYDRLRITKSTKDLMFISENLHNSKSFWETGVSNLLSLSGGDLSFNHNFHVSNWLHNVLILILHKRKVNIIDTKDLDKHILQTYKDKLIRMNVPNNRLSAIFDEIFEERKIKTLKPMDRYLENESNIYRWLKLSFLDDMISEKDQLKECIRFLNIDIETDYGLAKLDNKPLTATKQRSATINSLIQDLIV